MNTSKKLRIRDYFFVGSTALTILFSSYSRANAQAGPWPAEDKRDSIARTSLTTKIYQNKRNYGISLEELQDFSTTAVNPRIRS
ncbi:MAG: hypothetical protein AABW56_03860 [Nanoarchaeota archaeon]